MTNRFYSPFQQFFDATPTVRSGARLFFYAAGTSTKQNTFSDTALSVANNNPITLNALGQSDTDIYLSDLSYKVVLAPPGSDDPPSSPIFTADNYYIPPSVAQFKSGSGSPNGSVAGTAGSAGVPASVYWDSTNSVLYVCTQTGTTVTAVWTAITTSTVTNLPIPQGRLTPTTGTPVISAGVTAGTSVFYTPYIGNQIPIHNGSVFVNTTFSELTLSLVASHTANNLYDCFVFNNSGVITLVTGPAWTTATFGSGARGTGAGTTQLTRLNGVLVNTVAMTGRNGATTYSIAANRATYVGTILVDGTNGQVSCLLATGQSRRWGIWNYYNRREFTARCIDPTASWTYTVTGFRVARADATNNIVLVHGFIEDMIEATYYVAAHSSAGGIVATVNIGVNSTSVASGIPDSTDINAGYSTADCLLISNYVAQPNLGGIQFYPLESGTNAGTVTFTASSNQMMLSVRFFA